MSLLGLPDLALGSSACAKLPDSEASYTLDAKAYAVKPVDIQQIVDAGKKVGVFRAEPLTGKTVS